MDQIKLIFFLFTPDNKCLIWTVHVAYGSQIKLFQRLTFLAKEGEVRIRQHPGSSIQLQPSCLKTEFGQFTVVHRLSYKKDPTHFRSPHWGHLNRIDPSPGSSIKSRREKVALLISLLCPFPKHKLPTWNLLPNIQNTVPRDVSDKASRKV